MTNMDMFEWMRKTAEAAQHCLPQSGASNWLLQQTQATHLQRLAILPAMIDGLNPQTILDVGAGTGAFALDLAWQSNASIVALDQDPGHLAVLNCLSQHLAISVETILGNAVQIPLADATIDLSVSRFVFQHLPDQDLHQTLAEMIRVTRSGGRIAIMEIDDGARIEHPPLPSNMAKLYQIIENYQNAQQGDRRIGRKLASLFRDAGLHSIRVIAVPRAAFVDDHFSATEALVTQEQVWLEEFRSPLVKGGWLTSDEFDAGIHEARHLYEQPRFRYASEFLVFGEVP